MYSIDKQTDIKRVLRNDEELYQAFEALFMHASMQIKDLYVMCNTNYMTINSSKRGNLYAFQRTEKDKLFLSLNGRKFIFKALDVEKYKEHIDEQIKATFSQDILIADDAKDLQKRILVSYDYFKNHKENAILLINKFAPQLKKFYDSLIIQYDSIAEKILDGKELQVFKASVISNKNIELETDGFMNSNFTLLIKAKDRIRGRYNCSLLLKLKVEHLIPFLAYMRHLNFRFFKLVIEQYVLFDNKFDDVLKLISEIDEMYVK